MVKIKKSYKLALVDNPVSFILPGTLKTVLLFLSIILLIFSLTSAAGCRKSPDYSDPDFQQTISDNISGPESGFSKNILVVTGSTTMLEVSLAWSEAFMEKFGGEVTINGGGSGEGIKALLHQTTDLTNASRAISESEKKEALANNIAIKEFIVLMDGIAVIVSKNVGVEQLSFEQLSKIYIGEIVNWNEVGGHDREIVVAARDTTSGTGEYFLEAVVRTGDKNSDDLYSDRCLLFQTNSEMATQVSQNNDLIGFISLGYLKFIEEKVNIIKIQVDSSTDAAAPTIEAVREKIYPISRDLYIYANENRLSDIARAYIDFIYSIEGQGTGADAGFVPVRQ